MSRFVRFLLKALGTLVALIVLVIAAFSIYLSTRPPGKTVKAAGIISVPAPFRIARPFIDYMLISGPRLYAGYASHGMVGVIDTTTNQVVATIGGLGRVHGVATVADRNLGFASSSGDNNVNVFDLATNKLLKKIPAGDDPDAIIYDRKAQLIYVGDHNGKTATLIDPAAEKVMGTIALGGEPEYPQADPESGLVYQNLEDTSELVVIDPQKQIVVKRYKIDPGEGPTGLAFDAADHRLFSTASNRKLIVLNADTGNIVAVLPIGAGVDGAGYDPSLHRVYTANGAGTMTVIQQDSPDHYRVLENAPTHFGGHSLVIDPTTHRIYVAYFGSIAMYDALP
ncbi:MAG TPA: YncE family protein [Candidatus Acidoferrales bacterium]|nr:YncE family protein [Candidatus Acidoferrales bacterium]